MTDPANTFGDSHRDAVAVDVACRRCGYNLRGLSRGARCPECGIETGGVRRGFTAADREWLRQLALGCRVAVASQWVMAATSCAFCFTGPFLAPLVPLLLLASWFGISAWWMFARGAPDEWRDAEVSRRRRRMIAASVSGYLALAAGLLGWWLDETGRIASAAVAPGLLPLALLLIGLGFSQRIGLMHFYFGDLGETVEARHCRQLAVEINITTGVTLVAILLGIMPAREIIGSEACFFLNLLLAMIAFALALVVHAKAQARYLSLARAIDRCLRESDDTRDTGETPPDHSAQGGTG